MSIYYYSLRQSTTYTDFRYRQMCTGNHRWVQSSNTTWHSTRSLVFANVGRSTWHRRRQSPTACLGASSFIITLLHKRWLRRRNIHTNSNTVCVQRQVHFWILCENYSLCNSFDPSGTWHNVCVHRACAIWFCWRMSSATTCCNFIISHRRCYYYVTMKGITRWIPREYCLLLPLSYVYGSL